MNSSESLLSKEISQHDDLNYEFFERELIEPCFSKNKKI